MTSTHPRMLKTVVVAAVLYGLAAYQPATATGLSIHIGGKHVSKGMVRHPGRGAVGKVTINRQSPRVHSHHRLRAHRNRHYSTPRSSSHISPATRFYSQQQANQAHYGTSHFSHPRQLLDNGIPVPYPGEFKLDRGEQPWRALAYGDTGGALRLFSLQSRAYPHSSIPRVGYALSAAFSGDLNQGSITMRQAFRLAPRSLHNYHARPYIQPLIFDLIGRYHLRLQQRGGRRDGAFMLAALHYLNRDYSEARQALSRARSFGDRRKSTRNLDYILNLGP